MQNIRPLHIQLARTGMKVRQQARSTRSRQWCCLVAGRVATSNGVPGVALVVLVLGVCCLVYLGCCLAGYSQAAAHTTPVCTAT